MKHYTYNSENFAIAQKKSRRFERIAYSRERFIAKLEAVDEIKHHVSTITLRPDSIFTSLLSTVVVILYMQRIISLLRFICNAAEMGNVDF